MKTLRMLSEFCETWGYSRFGQRYNKGRRMRSILMELLHISKQYRKGFLLTGTCALPSSVAVHYCANFDRIPQPCTLESGNSSVSISIEEHETLAYTHVDLTSRQLVECNRMAHNDIPNLIPVEYTVCSIWHFEFIALVLPSSMLCGPDLNAGWIGTYFFA